MRKRWFLVALLVAVLALGITGGTTLARTNSSSDDPPWADFASRVASILGLDQLVVKSAFDRAERDSQDERHLERLDQYVEQGCLTQQEAERYYEWFQSRPEGIITGRHTASCEAAETIGATTQTFPIVKPVYLH